MNCKEYLVTLNIPPSLEEMMVDSLLMLEAGTWFQQFSGQCSSSCQQRFIAG